MISFSVSFSDIAFLALLSGLLAIILDSGKLPLNPLSTLLQSIFVIGCLYILIPAIFLIQRVRGWFPESTLETAILEVEFNNDGEFIAARAFGWQNIGMEDYRLLPWVVTLLVLVFMAMWKKVWATERLLVSPVTPDA